MAYTVPEGRKPAPCTFVVFLGDHEPPPLGHVGSEEGRRVVSYAEAVLGHGNEPEEAILAPVDEALIGRAPEQPGQSVQVLEILLGDASQARALSPPSLS